MIESQSKTAFDSYSLVVGAALLKQTAGPLQHETEHRVARANRRLPHTDPSA